MMTPPLWFMNDQSFRVHLFQPTSMWSNLQFKRLRVNFNYGEFAIIKPEKQYG